MPMSHESKLSTCWRRRQHLNYLMQELNAEVPRISSAVEWASGLQVPQEKIKEQIAQFQEMVSECSELAAGVEPVLANPESELDEMREALDSAIESAADILSFRGGMISNLIYWAPHPNKIKNSEE